MLARLQKMFLPLFLILLLLSLGVLLTTQFTALRLLTAYQNWFVFVAANHHEVRLIVNRDLADTPLRVRPLYVATWSTDPEWYDPFAIAVTDREFDLARGCG